MQSIGKTQSGYTVKVIPPCHASPMVNHKGGEIAVDDETHTMYAWEVFVVTYGVDSIMRACNQYRS